ncbi:RtcB family protein [Acinetobacter sp.]|uniref:RtcB family protein n=1 Tax=Acinetobacter sp. TaxID=472 RepID=UPI003CFCCDE7
MHVIYNKQLQRIPIKAWTDDKIDQNTMDQALNLSNLPFAFKHVALMPDMHVGYGMPIGGVLATDNVVIPNAVGVDIGCGMQTSHLYLFKDDIPPSLLKQIIQEIREAIPVGFDHHKTPVDFGQQEWLDCTFGPESLKYRDKIGYQIGTLGGGNHFIEIQADMDDRIHIMIHSGSRNIGYEIANYYNQVAKELNKQWYTAVPPEYDLAFLPLYTREGQEYMLDMEFAVNFAKANRTHMMNAILDIFKKHFKHHQVENRIDVPHNYAALEHHFNKNVMVHRKGATRARLGELGIIPGSQGTFSYIVEGLGNKDSFESCSHGAGRQLGRKQACATLNLEEEQAKLDAKGIIHSVRSVNDLDEAPGAYKDIDVVMENQEDLVKIVHKLRPVAVIKG